VSERPKLPNDPPAADDPGTPVTLETERGPLVCRLHEGVPDKGGVVLVGGTDAGLQGPADWIYPTLGEDLKERGIATLRVDFRDKRVPGVIEQAVFDIRAAAAYLVEERQAGPVAVVGHSFGGAAAIAAGVRDARISAVVGLSNQTLGAQEAGLLAPRPLLLVHGLDDDRLPPDCSRLIYRWAEEPKELVLLEGAKHSLRQRREELRQLLVDWLAGVLGASGV
jgi:alpha-beta hydrolase superfamily lysophospholipase